MALGPGFAWSEYLVPGVGKAIATDTQGNTYVIGEEEAYVGPVYVAKLSPTGAVLWAYKYNGTTEAHGIAADASGNVFILAWDSNAGISILAKLSGTTGGVLGSVTFPLGLLGLALDGTGNVYMTGEYGQPNSSAADVVVYKLTSSLAYVYGGIFGGSDYDSSKDIRIDGSGNVYVAGGTYSLDLPGAQNAPFGGGDAFLAKIDPTGSSLLFTRYVGTANADLYGGLAVDGSGNAYLGWVSNLTASLPALLPGSVQAPTGGQEDGVITKLSPSGAPISSGRFGGSSSDYIYGVAVDSAGAVSIAGFTISADFPVTGSAAIGSYRGGGDAFVLQINASGTALSYSSYLGGTSTDQGNAIALDGAKNVYVTGYTYSSDFPVTNGSVLPSTLSTFAAKYLEGSDTVAPTCAITSPADGATVSGTVSLTASASDNVGVAKVEFLVDGAVIGTDLYSPYSASWNTAGFANGSHSLACRAYDAAGNTGSSSTTVTVNNPPTCTLAYDKTTVPSGGNATLTLTTTGTIPGSSRVYLSGTRNGVTDFNNYDAGFLPYSQYFRNSYSSAGYYRRWVVVKAYDGSTVCTSNIATVTFEAPKCTAAFSKSVVAPGSSVVFSLSSVGDIPSGSISYLYGTKNGVTDEPGNAFSGPNFSYTITNTAGLAGYYERWLIVKTSGGQTVCQSNHTSTTFQ